MADALVLMRLALAAVLITAAVGKLLDRSGSRDAMVDFDVPDRIAGAVALLVPSAEFATAAALVFAATASWGGASALGLMAIFVAALVRVLRRGDAPDCHCFGQVHSGPASWITVGRNVALALPAAFVVAAGPGPSLVSWVNGHSAQELWLIATSSLSALATATSVVLWRQNRALRTTGSIKPTIAPRIGARAPRFSLPSAGGPTFALQDLLADGRPSLLTFVAKGCGPCAALLPEVARWEDVLADRLSFPVLSLGEAESAVELVRQYGLVDVLVDAESQVSRAYGIEGTPSAVLINPDGTVGSSPAAGQLAIEALVRLALLGDRRQHLAVDHAGTGTKPAATHAGS